MCCIGKGIWAVAFGIPDSAVECVCVCVCVCMRAGRQVHVCEVETQIYQKVVQNEQTAIVKAPEMG